MLSDLNKITKMKRGSWKSTQNCQFSIIFLYFLQRDIFILVLQSIFPPMSLLKFMQQGRIDKRAQIRELAHVVAGIRIYNWVI